MFYIVAGVDMSDKLSDIELDFYFLQLGWSSDCYNKTNILGWEAPDPITIISDQNYLWTMSELASCL